DGDDVFQRLVLLQHFLHAAGDGVMLLADHLWVQDSGGRVQRVHRREDAQRGDVARQDGGGVKVRERSRRCRVGQVVGGHVDRLHRGDRTLGGGGDALLQV